MLMGGGGGSSGATTMHHVVELEAIELRSICRDLRGRLELSEAELHGCFQRLAEQKKRSATREAELYDEIDRLRHEVELFRRGAVVTPMRNPRAEADLHVRFGHAMSQTSPVRRDQNRQPYVAWDDHPSDALNRYSPNRSASMAMNWELGPSVGRPRAAESLPQLSVSPPQPTAPLAPSAVPKARSGDVPPPPTLQAKAATPSVAEEIKPWQPSFAFFECMGNLAFREDLDEAVRSELLKAAVLREMLEHRTFMVQHGLVAQLASAADDAQ